MRRARTPTTRAHDWPLVGRDDELRRLGAELRTGSRAVVLSGPAGVGKSRLAAELAQRATDEGDVRLRAVASGSSATIPFGALAPVLPRIGTERDPLALLHLVQQRMAEQAAGKAVLLWLDDVHHLDPGSATLVHQLVTTRTCRVLATVRSDTAVPDAVEALWRSGEAQVVELAPLTVDDVQVLVESVLGGPVARGTTQRLWERSGGNPLYLRELLEAARSAGSLDDSTGVWALRRRSGTSPRLDEMLRARLGRLDEPDREVLELLALADVLSVSLLAGLVPDADLEGLESRGVVVVAAEGRRTEVRLAHPLHGEILRAGVPVLRRRRHHAALADAAAARGARRREDVLRTAVWQLDADRTVDPDLLAVAADQAAWRFDLSLATRLADAALAGGAGVGARVTLAEVAFRSGRPEDALELLTKAAGLARTDEEVMQVADAHAHVLSVLGRAPEAVAVLTAVRDRLGPEDRALVDGRMAVLLIFAGRPERALEASARLVADHGSRPSLPWRARLRADYVDTIALALLGRPDQAAEIADVSADWITRSDEVAVPPEQLTIGRCLAYLYAGRLAEAGADAAAVETAMVRIGDRDGEVTGALLLGRVALAAGDLDAALAHFRRAVGGYRELGDVTGLRWALGGLALAHGMRDEGTAAEAAAEQIASLEGAVDGLFAPDLVHRGAAWAELAAGRFDTARAALARAAGLAQELGQPAPEVVLRLDLLRLGDRGQHERLSELAEPQDPGTPLARAAALWAAATVSGGGDAYAAAAAAFEAAGALVEAAEASLAAAAAYRDSGLARRSTAAARHATELAGRCPGARAPGLRAAAAVVALTSREREIADLAARRLSAAQIADRLVLSRRTVENHLQRIYTKLGISSRAELEQRLTGD